MMLTVQNFVVNGLVEVFLVCEPWQLLHKFSAHQIQIREYLCDAANGNARADDLLRPKLSKGLWRSDVNLFKPCAILRLILDGAILDARKNSPFKILQRISLENDVPTVNEQHGGILVSPHR